MQRRAVLWLFPSSARPSKGAVNIFLQTSLPLDPSAAVGSSPRMAGPEGINISHLNFSSCFEKVMYSHGSKSKRQTDPSDTVYISDIVLLLIPFPERTSVTLQRDSVTHNTIFPLFICEG